MAPSVDALPRCEVLLLASALSACSPGPSPERELPVARAQLRDGDFEAAGYGQVAHLRNEGVALGVVECAGTLVAPNLMATSRACVAAYDSEPFKCHLDGGISSDSGEGGLFGPDPVSLQQLLVYVDKAPVSPDDQPDARGAAIIDDGGEHLCGHDLAFIVLDRDIPGIDLLPLHIDEAPRVDDRVDVVGWGARDDGTSYVKARNVRRSVPVTAVNPSAPVPGDTSEDRAPRTFHTDLIVCTGDAGGGAFTTSGALVGVASSSFQELGSIGFCGVGFSTYSMLSAFPEVVAEAYAAAGQPIWRAGNPYPGSVELDGRCRRDENCASGVCLLQDEEGGFCAEGCAADRDCREGTLCRLTDDGGYCSARLDAEASGCATGTGSSKGRSWWVFVMLTLAAALRVSSSGGGWRSGRGD